MARLFYFVDVSVAKAFVERFACGLAGVQTVDAASETCAECLLDSPRKGASCLAMPDTRTQQQLRKRIAEYRHLRSVTIDRQALEAIDTIIAEAEASLRRLNEGQT